MADRNKSMLCCSKSYNSLMERLFDSIRSGEAVGTIQAILQEGIDINGRDSKGFTPILLACLHRRKEIVDLLIKSGANVAVQCDKCTVLHYASEYAWTNIVRTLVQKMPDLDAGDSWDETALHHATRSGCLEIVKSLVEKGADLDRKNINGLTPLIIAVMESKKDIVDFLLDSGAKVDEGDFLYFASYNGWTELVLPFIEKVHHPIIYSSGLTPLYGATAAGHLDLVKGLVGAGLDINERNDDDPTPLHEASHKGHLAIVKWLVENGADINAKQFSGNTPVLEAAESSNREVVELLMHCGADVDATNVFKLTLLHFASRNGWMEVVKFAVKRNCDLEAKSVTGMTALSEACLFQRFDIAQYLLQEGARWDVVDEEGNLPLNYITNEENPEFKLIKLFIEYGAHLNHVDYKGLMENNSLEVLQDVKLCVQAIVNQFNNHDLPELFKLPVSGNLPRITEMKIASGSEAAQAVEQAVVFEIQAKGHCNILEVQPVVLSVISVRSILEYCKKKKAEVRSGQKRPAAFDPNDKCQHPSKVMFLL